MKMIAKFISFVERKMKMIKFFYYYSHKWKWCEYESTWNIALFCWRNFFDYYFDIFFIYKVFTFTLLNKSSSTIYCYSIRCSIIKILIVDIYLLNCIFCNHLSNCSIYYVFQNAAKKIFLMHKNYYIFFCVFFAWCKKSKLFAKFWQKMFLIIITAIYLKIAIIVILCTFNEMYIYLDCGFH